MNVHIESPGAANQVPRRAAAQRLRFGMRRLNWLVASASVSLSDVNGPRGGLDKRCQVELRTNASTPPVVVTALARDWRFALDKAVVRAKRVLLSSWRRLHGDARRPTGIRRPALNISR